MQAVKGVTEDGYLNPKNEMDWTMVRQMINATSREMDEKDVEFIQKMLIEPKEKDQNPSRSTRSSTTNASTKKTSPSRGRQGKGTKGRPTGSSNKQNNPRSSQR
jgi:hypothetical protein